MGIELYVEVLKQGPRDVKGSELVVLLVLAEDARDATRRTWLGMEELAYRSRCGESTVRGHLAKLEERKVIKRLEAPQRQPGATPVVAYRGHRTVYEILPMTEMSDTEAPGSQRLPGSERRQDPAERRQDPSERRQDPSGKAPGSWPPSPHAPQVPSSHGIGEDVIAAVQAVLRDRTGREVGPTWARMVATQLLAHRSGISSPARYVRAVIEREVDVSRFLPTPGG